MNRFLNVGIIQMPLSYDTAINIEYFSKKVEELSSAYHRPELIIGVEGGIGYCTPQPIPGPITEYFGRLAKKHEVYILPGTMYEKSDGLPEGMFYNTVPVFNPQGEMVASYRKMAPWRPMEENTAPGKEYIVFDIPEKNTKVGIIICYDSNFPEISRNLTLMGAEIIIKLTQDPQELFKINRPIHFTRALENQAYFVCTNGVGFAGGMNLYGHSQVISPEGNIIWEAEQNETMATVTLDIELVHRCRHYGTIFMDHYLQHVGDYNFPMPYANKILEAPLMKTLPRGADNPGEYEQRLSEIDVGTIGKAIKENDVIDYSKFETNLENYLNIK